ncbi:ABC transporter ATP-binding protein [Rufibacter quisquiliarum]|uniref:Peptide/nickel transport system ATP-binding protein n=1 Tax=Rufibacter quisquiliarum TaxID=1549639 RepID=A0A839GNF2_9BACT|nr:ABC transporter ATP-binding protein [Rufibacter quisquiliarum]MBA9075958.1 peptide/nickel transport system ATP-binding protein [Rufibacter quisquiliarum]
MKKPLLQVDQLSIQFQTRQGLVQAVQNMSFQLQKGETLAIVGESGSGKTVTALSLMQLLETQSATVAGNALFNSPKLGEVDLFSLPEKQMQKIRGNDISIVFQDPMSSLNPVISCGKQVMEVLQIHLTISKEEAYQRTLRLLEMVQLPQPEKIYRSFPHQLSGGQKQRVMIAMAMACEPSILIADEPTTALDVTVQAAILDLLNELRLKNGTSVLFISHDLGVVAQMADRILVMFQGQIVEQGTTLDIFTQPQHPYTKALLACRPTLKTQVSVLPTIADFLSAKADKQVVAREETFSPEPSFAVDKAAPITAESHNPQPEKEPEQPLLQVEDVHVGFSVSSGFLLKQKERITAVNGVSFEVFPGETMAIVGESGCGKTTLGRALVRLIEPSSGKILFNGKDWSNLPKEELRKSRKDFQMIFQDPFASLNPHMKIGEAIMEPMQAHQVLKSSRERRQRALELLETVGLLPEHFNRYPHEFSGGQQQRICIARALALEPTCIICDEVVSSLDVSVQAQVLNLLNRLKREFHLTILFITHDLAVAKFMADRLLVMDKGQIVEQGPAPQIFSNPQHAYTKTLLQAVPTGELADILAAQEKRKAYKASIDE